VDAPPLTLAQIARLPESFPDSVIIPPHVIEEGSKPWRLALVGKFLGHSVGLDKGHQGFHSLRTTQHDLEIFPMTNGFFIFLFTDAADCDRVLMDGP